jgi:hypothetical protein
MSVAAISLPGPARTCFPDLELRDFNRLDLISFRLARMRRTRVYAPRGAGIGCFLASGVRRLTWPERSALLVPGRRRAGAARVVAVPEHARIIALGRSS